MSGEVVPFGKYKGQPVEVLAADSDYCEWLTAQPWFKARYLNVYNTVINYGAEPQDSPEHNEMQARFLDDQWCFQLADLIWPKRAGTYNLEAARKLLHSDPMYLAFRECCDVKNHEAGVDREFEDRGWDVTFDIAPASISAHRIRLVPPLPACSCECDHSVCYPTAKCHGGGDYCRHDRHGKRGIDGDSHCVKDCYWSTLSTAQRDWLREVFHEYWPGYSGRILVELKPDLGDDYPSVLRQVTAYKHEYRDARCVVARRHDFAHVTWEQVQKIFAASQIRLLAEREIAAP